MHVVIGGHIRPEGVPMLLPKSLQAAIGPTLMAFSAAAIVGCLAVLAPGVFGVAEVRAETHSKLVIDPVRATNEIPLILVKGEACSLLEWPNYDRSCQFDVRPRAAEMRTVRIIAVR
jgi:hypothetical protein